MLALSDVDRNISWFGYDIDLQSSIVVFLLYYAFWIVIAVYRCFRAELQCKNSPLVLMIFLVSLCLYISGWISSPEYYRSEFVSSLLSKRLVVSFAILASALYLATFVEASDFGKYRRWAYAYKNKEWKRFFENMPAWAGCLVLVLPVFAVLNIHEALSVENGHNSVLGNVSVVGITSASLLFTLRDGAVLHALYCSRIDKHRGFLLCLYYVLSYVLLPFIVSKLVASNDNDALRDMAMHWFYPGAGRTFFDVCFPVMVQALVALIVLLTVRKKSAAALASPSNEAAKDMLAQ